MTIEEALLIIDRTDPSIAKKVCLSQTETAKVIGVSCSTLTNWREQAVGIDYIKGGGGKSRILYPKQAIAQYLMSVIKVN